MIRFQFSDLSNHYQGNIPFCLTMTASIFICWTQIFCIMKHLPTRIELMWHNLFPVLCSRWLNVENIWLLLTSHFNLWLRQIDSLEITLVSLMLTLLLLLLWFCFRLFISVYPGRWGWCWWHLSIKVLCNQYRDSHDKYKTVSLPSVIFVMGISIPEKTRWPPLWIVCPGLLWCVWCRHYEHITVIAPLDSVLSWEQGQHREWHITLKLPQRLFCSHLLCIEEVAHFMLLHLHIHKLWI